MEKFIVDDTQT